MNESSETPDLPTLSALFYPTTGHEPSLDLGQFKRVAASEIPPLPRALLAHDGHMTVTMEHFHGGPVDVEVLDRRASDDGRHYSRKIRLRTRAVGPNGRGKVVQFGIVRMNLDYFPVDVRREVLSEGTPLGRLLIDHDLLTKVRLIGVWRIEPGTDLCRSLEIGHPTTVYGRTAMIDIEREPVIELLEVSAPVGENRGEVRK